MSKIKKFGPIILPPFDFDGNDKTWLGAPIKDSADLPLRWTKENHTLEDNFDMLVSPPDPYTLKQIKTPRMLFFVGGPISWGKEETTDPPEYFFSEMPFSNNRGVKRLVLKEYIDSNRDFLEENNIITALLNTTDINCFLPTREFSQIPPEEYIGGEVLIFQIQYSGHFYTTISPPTFPLVADDGVPPDNFVWQRFSINIADGNPNPKSFAYSQELNFTVNVSEQASELDLYDFHSDRWAKVKFVIFPFTGLSQTVYLPEDWSPNQIEVNLGYRLSQYQLRGNQIAELLGADTVEYLPALNLTNITSDDIHSRVKSFFGLED